MNTDDEKLAQKIVERNLQADPKSKVLNKRIYLLLAFIFMIATFGLIILSLQFLLDYLYNNKADKNESLDDMTKVFQSDKDVKDALPFPSLRDDKTDSNQSRLKNVETHFDSKKQGYIQLSLKGKGNLQLAVFDKESGNSDVHKLESMDKLKELSLKYIKRNYMVFIEMQGTDQNLNGMFMKFCIRQKTPFYETIGGGL